MTAPSIIKHPRLILRTIRWKLAAPDDDETDPDEQEAAREAAEEARAERQREDMMFDRDNLEDW